MIYETMVGVAFAAGSVGAYLGAAKAVNVVIRRGRPWRTECSPPTQPPPPPAHRHALTSDELSAHHTLRRSYDGKRRA